MFRQFFAVNEGEDYRQTSPSYEYYVGAANEERV
jgi:hypothetical protein